MTSVITIPQNYGYVLAVSLIATPLLAVVHGQITSSKRKAAKIPYPNCYASAQEMKTNPAAYQFNCAQRAHAQFMENAPQALMSMLVAGVMYPNATTWLGVGWLVSRAMYLYGYVYSSQEMGKGRHIGGGFWLAQGGLWGLVGMTAYNLLY